jgi:hypothetical protein
MKTIFRSFSAAAIFAAVIVLGAVTGFGQNPCEDADGQAKLDAAFRSNYQTAKPVADRKVALESGKQYLEKYGSCDGPTKEFSDYLKGYLPKLEASIKSQENKIRIDAIVNRFLDGMKSKNWDDVFASGKQLIAENPDDYRAVELVLGSIGLDETAKSPRVTKWNDETLRYAKQSIADMEAGKTFKTYGIFVKDGANFQYKDKGDALGWMNYTVGFILSVDKNNKKDGASYLYKAAQAQSDTKSNPVVYEWIGAYYFDDAKKLIGEVRTLAAEQKTLQDGVSSTDTPEVKQQKLDAIKAKSEQVKAKVGVLNGTLERAMDAYSRAYTFAPDTAAGKSYKDSIKATLGQLYNVRFEKTDGLDAYVKAVAAKPLPDPSTAITPILDQDPTTTTTTTTSTKPITPAAKPGAVVKPQSETRTSTKSASISNALNNKAVAKKGMK